MSPERAALRRANLDMLDTARDRLGALRQLEIEALDRVGRGLLDPTKHRETSGTVVKAVDTLRAEIATRDALQEALAARDPDSDARVEALLTQLDAQRAAQRDAFYKGEAKVADPCIPCLAKALLAEEEKRLKKLPGMDRKKLKKAISRIKKKIMQADPEVLAAINDQLGTKVNFAALSRFEGGQWTHGYVPPAGRSGVTIGTGFDVGQWRASDLRNKLGMPDDIADRLAPYTGHIRDSAVAQLRASPLSVTRDEANVIDQASHRYFVRETMGYWDAHRGPDTPAFRDLTSAQQTVLFSRSYHQGIGMPSTAVARDFYSAAQHNDWVSAESNLRNYPVRQGWYRERVGAEARLLHDERTGDG